MIGSPAFIIVANCLVKFATSFEVTLSLNFLVISIINSALGLMETMMYPFLFRSLAAILSLVASTSPLTTSPVVVLALYLNLFIPLTH